MAAGSRPYIAPGFVAARVLNPLMMRLGLVPTLAVRGRRTGKVRTVPISPIECDGARYLVSPRGQSQWARNLRAAGRGELRTRAGVERFRAVEVDSAERARVIAAYRKKVGGPVKRQFDRLPDPADHPTFRIEPLGGSDIPRAGDAAGPGEGDRKG